MKLLTKEIETELVKAWQKREQEEAAAEAAEMRGEEMPETDYLDRKVIVKLFNPCGAGTWLITEGQRQENGEWLLFGYCHLFEWEWGYVSLQELEEIKLPFGLTIERELYESGGKYTVKELAR